MLEPISISFESLNFSTLVPMLVAVGGALLILCVDLFSRNNSNSFYAVVTILFVLLDFSMLLGFSDSVRGFFDLILMDGISLLSQGIVLLASALFIPLTLTSKRYHEYSYPEFYALFLFMIAGFQFMVSSDSLILIFVGLETASLALYALIALHNRKRAFEAAIKYFTLGAMAAAFFAMGSMILYGVSGSVEISKISQVLVTQNFEPSFPVFAGVACIIVAIGFKISIVPFHTWTPDVYEGSSAVLAGYMSIVPKIAGFVVALRFFEVFVDSGVIWIENLLYASVVITMTLPNLLALMQEDVKRMLAYSSISHAGFGLAAILIGSSQAHTALFLYWTLFLFTNLGAFAMLWMSRHKTNRFHDRFDHPYSKFSGMIYVLPLGAVLMALFMLSLAGVPPFSVFWGKLYLMSASVNSGYIVLAVLMGLNSAVSAYYYLRLIVYMFLREPADNITASVYLQNATFAPKIMVGVSAVLTLFSVLYVGSLLDLIHYYVVSSGF
jgi:NADH-quinone oxidoreductase subunit N